MAGVPIYPTRGRGGGWRLVGGARTDLTGLTEGEVTALFIGLSQTGAGAGEHAAAVRKLVHAVPSTFREKAGRVAEATVHDASWGDPDDARERPLVARLQSAIADRRLVRLDYEGARGSASSVLVPLVVGSRGARWYVLGAPPQGGVADPGGIRTYRVDRIAALDVLDESGAPPDGFDGPAQWRRMVDEVEGLRSEARAVVRPEPWAFRALRDRFGRQASPVDGDDDCLQVRAQSVPALAEQLAGWADVIEVIEPVEVRRALRELGERIALRHRDE